MELGTLSQKRPRVRFSGLAEAYQPTDVREYFRAQYVKMI